ncbi:MAG: F0F1 ATP synthase subunit B [Bacillota bacterium]
MFHFLLLLVLLRLFAYRPLLKVLDDRRRFVAEQIAAAEKARKEAEELLAQRRELLVNAREEARAILARAETAAENRTREVLEQARAASDSMQARAAAEIERQKNEARRALHAELADLVLLATAKVAGQAIDRNQHFRLVQNAVEEVGRQRA